MKKTPLATTPLQRLAQLVADALGLGKWDTDLIAREIGTADTLAQATARLDSIERDLATARRVIAEWRRA